MLPTAESVILKIAIVLRLILPSVDAFGCGSCGRCRRQGRGYHWSRFNWIQTAIRRRIK